MKRKKYNTGPNTLPVINSPKAPIQRGEEFDTWLREVKEWKKDCKENDYKKYQMLIVDLKQSKNENIRNYVNTIVLVSIEEGKKW